MPKQFDDTNAYPANDQPPKAAEDDKNKSGQGDQGHADDKGGQGNQGNQGGDQGDQGNKSGDDYKTRYENLEKKLGEQGKEMGDLKKQNQELMQQLQQMQSGDQNKATGSENAPDYEAKINEIYQQLDNGDISVEDALRQSNSLTAEMAQKNADELASKKVQEALEEKDQETQMQKFFEQHPDFKQLQESGELDKVKQEMPGFHDDFSAYFAHKARTAEQEAYERGKKEMEELSQGDAGTDKVLQGQGSTIHNQNPEPLHDEGEIKQSMMKRLQEHRKSG